MREVLEEDDTLSAEAACEEDEDGTGLKTGPELGRVVCLASLEREDCQLRVVAKLYVRVSNCIRGHLPDQR